MADGEAAADPLEEALRLIEHLEAQPATPKHDAAIDRLREAIGDALAREATQIGQRPTSDTA